MAIKKKSLVSQFARQFQALWERSFRQYVPAGLEVVAIASIAVTGLLVGVRHLGWLQPVELAAYDLMVQLRPDQGPDPRLLVVAITEQDIQNQNQWPISDRVLAQVLAKLQQYQPRAIGLDLVRNLPQEPGHEELVTQFQNPKVIAVTFIGGTDDRTIPPPPSIPEDRIGFSDVLPDLDGNIRRNLLFANNGKSQLSSFSLQLAFTYLADLGIAPRLTKSNNLQLDRTTFTWLTANSGGYQLEKSPKYQILINYRSPQNVARQVTLTQVLQGEIDPNWVKNKIVLIGGIAPSLKDSFSTPYSANQTQNRKMPGIFLHAQMVSQILSAVLDRRPLFWFFPKWVEVVWIGGWAVVGGILAGRINHPLLLGLGGIAMLCGLCGFSFFLFMQAGWMPLAAPTLALIFSGGFVVNYQLQQARGQNQMIMQLLGQQTSPEIAAALWNNRDRLLESGRLPGQVLTATIVLTDLKGFSTISEKGSPEWVMSWLNQYLGLMTKAVQTHHGIVNKFTGDGILAVFGVPVPRTTVAEIGEDAIRAVSCALAMGDRLQELNQEWISQGLPRFYMRVGIFTGPVMVGSLGGKERQEYGVIGDSVNTAARLESYQKERQPSICRILIAEETLVYLQGQFQVEPWGSLALKGKEHPVKVYLVVGRTSDSSFPNPG